MSKENGSIDVLKKAFDEGYKAFNTDPFEEHWIYMKSVNPYSSKSLLFKEWERGYNRGYFEQQKANKVAGI